MEKNTHWFYLYKVINDFQLFNDNKHVSDYNY